MEEEVVDYLYKWALSDGFKKSKEDFVKLLQTNDEVLSYAFEFAQKDGFKKDKNALGALVGRTTTAAPVATAEPATTEPTTTTPATTEPAKTEPAKTEVVAEDPVKELSNKPLEVVKAQGIPQREAEMPTADTTKMPPMVVKEAEPEVKEEPKKEMPIGENLLPVTEKTEVKAVETPSDKMVIKSEKKGKMKVAPEPIKIEPIKVETKGGQIQVEVPTFAVPEPRKKYKPYGEKGPDVYYSEEYDQYIIKDGDNRTVAEKGSGKYEEIDKKIGETVKSVKEGEGKCDPEEGSSCSITNSALSDYLWYKKNESGWRSSYEAALSKELDNRKEFFEEEGESLWSAYYNDERETTKSRGNILYGGEEPPKSDRFVTYKPFGNDQTLVYDKESGIILKQLNDKAPIVDLSSTNRVVDQKGNVVKQGSDRREYYIKYTEQNPNEGLKLWQAVELDHPEYKELKSIIEGVNYKKEKGVKNTYVAPTISTGIPVTEWSQVKEVPAVSDKMVIKSEAKVEEPKPVEEVKGIPSYDDLGINPEKDPGSFLGANKNVKFEKLSPDEIIEKGYLKGIGSDIKLERNVSLRYPDPPGTVFKKEKVGEREVYSSYDKANDKWYIYDENSNKDNWTEVKAGSVKALLNAKFKENNKIIDSKTDYNSEEEKKEMTSMRRSIMLNKYLPYVMKNWDNFSNEQQTKIKEDLNTGGLNILMRKYIEKDDPNLDFWLDVNDKFFKNQATSSNAIDVYGKGSENTYPSKFIEIPTLKKDVDEGRIKLLRSVAGDIFYDEKNDVFYYGEAFDRGELKRTKEMYNEGDGIYRESIAQTYLKTIKKGTPAYDKIKSSLSKYNK